MALRMEKYREALKLHSESGLCLRSISVKLGVHHSTVCRWLNQGVKPDARWGLTPITPVLVYEDLSPDERMALYRNAMKLHSELGLGSHRISKKLGIPESTVNGWLYRGRIPNRKPKPWHKGLTKKTDERVRRKAKALEGHVSWNKGLTKETDERVRRGAKALEGNVPWIKGKHRSEAFKRMMSLKFKGRVPWMQGKHHSEETKAKISATNTGHSVSEETRAKIREKRLLQVFPKKDTKIEVAIQEELDRRGIVYAKHVPLLGRYQVDVFIEPVIVIECNGDYWHSEEMWDGKTWAKDREKERLLVEAGYVFHSFWGSEIRADVVGCVDQVLGVV